MTSVSGCFGSGPSYEKLDTVEEISTVVDDLQLIEKPTDDAIDPTATAVVQLGVACQAMARRLRLLTWTVVAIVVYLVLKDV